MALGLVKSSHGCTAGKDLNGFVPTTKRKLAPTSCIAMASIELGYSLFDGDEISLKEQAYKKGVFPIVFVFSGGASNNVCLPSYVKTANSYHSS